MNESKKIIEPKALNKSVEIIKATDEGDDIIKFVASKEIIDRDGDLVYIDGIDTANFEKNPVFLYMHDMTDPLGKVVSLEKTIGEDGVKVLIAKVKFQDTPRGQYFLKLYQDEMLNAVSIRFRALEYSDNRETGGWNIYKSELWEISAVTIPANQEALRIKMIDIEKQLGTLEKRIDETEIVYSKILEIAEHLKAAGSGSKVGVNEEISERIISLSKRLA